MKKAALGGLIFLTGCAVLAPQEAALMTTAEMCYRARNFGPQSRAVVAAELQKRGTTCAAHEQEILSYQQMRMQQEQANLQGLQNYLNYQQRNDALKRPSQQPYPTNCITQNVGGTLMTNCR